MKELKEDDKVTFRVGDTVLNYEVWDTHVSCRDGYNNSRIFTELGLKDPQIKDLATHYYGYMPHGGDWPTYTRGDYAAATRLVKGVYDLCNLHNSKLKEHEEIPF